MNHWPLNKSYFWEQAPFFRLLLPLAIGIITYPNSIHSGQFLVFTLVAVAISFTSFLLLGFFSKRQHVLFSFISINSFLFFTAWALCFFADVRNNKDWFGHNLSTVDSFVAVLTQPPLEREKTWKYEVSITHSITNQKIEKKQGRAFIYAYKYPAVTALKEGDIITIPNKWQAIKNSGNPFEFDYKKFCARNSIYFQQFLSQKDISITHYANHSDLNWARRIHHWSKRQLEWYINDAATLGLLEAMLIGDQTELNPQLKQAYADTGIVHTIAISGAHIGIFFLLVLLLLFWIKHKKYHWVKYLAALPLLWAYVLIAGAPASAIRAATMFSILAIGFALQKSPNGINQLLTAAFIMLCTAPNQLYNIGFQLSFTAVLSIFIFYGPLYRSIFFTQKILRVLWSAISVSIAAEILVAPLVIYYFHLFPIQFIVANIVAYLFMGIILIGGMLLIATSSLPDVASLIGDMLIWLTSTSNDIVNFLRSVNIDKFHTLTFSFFELCMVYISIASFAVYIFYKKRVALYTGISFMALLLAYNVYEGRQNSTQQILVMYNIRSDSYTEFINGSTVQVLHRKKQPTQQTEQYVLQPAHINWHASFIDTTGSPSSFMKIGRKTVYIYNGQDSISKHVDYLLLTGTQVPQNVKSLRKAYTPDTIVIGNGFSKSIKASLLRQCEIIAQPIHDVAQQGAFILSSN